MHWSININLLDLRDYRRIHKTRMAVTVQVAQNVPTILLQKYKKKLSS